MDPHAKDPSADRSERFKNKQKLQHKSLGCAEFFGFFTVAVDSIIEQLEESSAYFSKAIVTKYLIQSCFAYVAAAWSCEDDLDPETLEAGPILNWKDFFAQINVEKVKFDLEAQY